MTHLQNGQTFPTFDVPAVGGGTISIPRSLRGSYGVVLIYRGAWCPYCQDAKALLKRKGVDFTEIEAGMDPTKRREMMDRSGRSTFPQIFVGDQHIGGCDDMMALERAGRLDPLLNAA